MSSIRSRLLTLLLAGLTIVLAAAGSAVYFVTREDLVRQFDAGLEARAHVLASLIKHEPVGLVFETGDAPRATMEDTYFEIRDSAGAVLRRSENLEDGTLPAAEVVEGGVLFGNAPLPRAISGRVASMAFRPRADPDDWEPADLASAKPELLTVTVAIDRQSLDQSLAALRRSLAVVGVAVAGLTAGLVLVVVGWGLAPLHRLARQLGHVDVRSLRGGVDAASATRELAPVYRELNLMLDRVERTLERERSFASAAAHELRTPLAELRATAEVATRWDDPGRAVSALHEMLAIGGEMERLVESLLLISRGHSRGVEGFTAEASIREVVAACLEIERETVRIKSLEIDVSLDGGGVLSGPVEAVSIITRNLVENAVHYTPARGSIRIGFESNGAAGGTLVVDNGPVDLALQDVTRMFEPFWRRDGSREDRRHAGLGLAVVETIATSVRLRVGASLSGDRLVFRVASST